MVTVHVQVGCNRTSRTTAEIEHRGADRKTFNKTIVPGPFVPTAVSAVGVKGQGEPLVVADDAIGRIAHLANLAVIDGFHAAMRARTRAALNSRRPMCARSNRRGS